MTSSRDCAIFLASTQGRRPATHAETMTEACAFYPQDPHAPRILECENDWKISPHGDADPDRDCYWVQSLEEALSEIDELLRIS